MEVTEQDFAGMVEFARRLIQTPSPMLDEGKVAVLVEEEMRRIGYDEIERDEVGNVLGIVAGGSAGPTIMLNGHMDHVGVSDADEWQHGPFDARVDNEFLYGRGAADMKASLAVMIHCGALIKRYEPRLRGKILTAAVVLEETGIAMGTQYVLKKIRPDAAIVGEPTGNQLITGHRGKGELLAVIRGKSCHASMPNEGVNPLFAMAEFVRRIGALDMPSDELLGKATLVPTKLQSNQPNTNVIASEIKLWLDWRSIPEQEAETFEAELNALLNECLTEGTSGEVAFSRFAGKCYTGKEVSEKSCISCFKIDARHPLVRIAKKALSKALDKKVEPAVVSFASDASALEEHGVPTILFGPGEPSMAHVRDERIELTQMREAANGFLGLLENLAEKL